MDNIKNTDTQQVTTSKEENKEEYHKEQFFVSWEQIKSLTGTKLIEGKKNKEICWKVIVLCKLDNFQAKNFLKAAGVKDI